MTGRDILIVEDETIVALDMKVRLEALGYRVVGLADNAAAALERAASAKPDLVLMDIKLRGGEDGVEVAARIRAQAELPIIFVTAFTDDGTLDRAMKASPYGYVVKPFHERELRIAIELALYKFQYELSMRRAKELAEEASRLKGEFLANMSHELKTPLNSVIGFLELALDRRADAEQAEYLGTALSSAKRLVSLIDSILDFARLDAGKVSARAFPFSLDEVLEECVELLAVGAHAKGLEVRYSRQAGLPSRAIGDAGRIRTILVSLAENAVKFTAKGWVRLAAEIAEPEEGSPPLPEGSFLLRLLVEDSGIGMPAERVERAFERFSQLDASRTRPAGGTGLGLAIVKKSAELLGGRVGVRSEEGRGCSFEILIPLDRELDELPPLEEGPRRRLVLAGFERLSVREARESLAALGCEFLAVPGLAEAATLLEGEAPRPGPGEACPAEAPALVLADEAALEEGLEEARKLRDRLLVCCRFGGRGRGLAALEGFRTLSLPLRALALGRALSQDPPEPAPRRREGEGRSEAGDRRRGLGDRRRLPRTEALREGWGQEAEPRLGPADPGLELLGRFADLLEEALDPLDCARIEREAKEYSLLLDQIGGCQYGRLAFSALLLARRGDGKGLGDLLGKARAALALEGRNQ